MRILDSLFKIYNQGKPIFAYPRIVSIYDSDVSVKHLLNVIPAYKPLVLRDESEGLETIARSIPRRDILHLKDVYIRADEGIVVTPDGKLISECLPSKYRSFRILAASGYNDLQPILSNGWVASSPCVTLGGGKYYGNHYHYLADELPRLMAINRINAKRLTVITPHRYNEEREVLVNRIVDSFGKQAAPTERKKWVYAESYYHLPYVGVDYCPLVPKGYSSKLAQSLSGPDVDSSSINEYQRIYVSRKNASKRRIVNGDELQTVLSRYGFTTILPEELSLSEQCSLFSQCEYILGLHGAGLTNMLFIDNCTVIELFSGIAHTHYRWLSSVLGHKYASITGMPSRSKNDDVTVDVYKLNDLLSKLISS